MICLFYRESQPGDIMHKHLSALAASHIETKFVKIHAEKSPFLTGMFLAAAFFRSLLYICLYESNSMQRDYEFGCFPR